MPEETVMSAEPETIVSESEQHKKEGNMYFASADYVKAVAAYNKAIKADPNNGVLYRCVCAPPPLAEEAQHRSQSFALCCAWFGLGVTLTGVCGGAAIGQQRSSI